MSLSYKASSGRCWLCVFLLALTVVLPMSVLAQDETPPKVDLFVGYQWLNPGGKVPDGLNSTGGRIPFKLPSIPQGAGAALGYNFTPHWALEGDFGGNWNKFANETTASIGPRFTWRTEGVNLFAHTLLGLNRLSTKTTDSSNGIGAILGGGIDLKLWKPLSIRLIEADYVFARHNFANEVSPVQSDLRRPTFDGARLRTGLVFNFGGAPSVPPAATCSVDHSEVMVGEPVKATVATSNFNPKHTLTYNWTTTGGKVSGSDTTANIDTTGVAGGSYTVTSHVVDPKMKKNGDATCTANFTVKEPPKNPPTMSCSANPATVQTGSPATITCTCTSPDNVPVTVAGWNATGGTISGEGNTATLKTDGAPAGAITVNATCTDSRGLTAPASTQVSVEVPPPPPPQASKLSECEFPNPKKPWRVDNTCKAVLDDVALRLQQEAEAKLVIVGFADDAEAKFKNLAAERAVNSKAYLSGGEAKQNIDPSRIEVRTGSGGGKKAEFWVVPAGATYNAGDTQSVDEGKIKAIPDHPRAAAPKKKKAAQ
ncbi:MAG TPA: outer membrane beta-barrel protein [Terriglobales bacterium]|jgi:hypothetical protein|nr:outer membrane beta-barrel protein [Terriglobales bacterium]